MKRKNILIALAALGASLALCAAPAALFAATDAALFSGTYTQNARRGSLDITGDDVYLARVLREPGETVYVESGLTPDLYAQTVIEKMGDLKEAGVFSEDVCVQAEEMVYICLDGGSIRCMIETTDTTEYYGTSDFMSFSVRVENVTGKVLNLYASLFYAAELKPGDAEVGTEAMRTLLEAYIRYLGFDVFGDWEYYLILEPDVMEATGTNSLWCVSETGGVVISATAAETYVSLQAMSKETADTTLAQATPLE